MKRKVVAKAKCASYDIEITATINSHGTLVTDEMNNVQRKLKQKIADTVSSLPFAHVYPHEVKLR